MAESKDNVITHGLSGKVGDMIVFSQRNGKTIVSKVPKKRVVTSERVKEHNAKFQQAVIYAKTILKDPAMKEAYQLEANKKVGLTAYNVAVADLFNAPEIKEIDLSRYTGQIGDPIKIRAYDDFKVKSVTVHIYNSDGSLLEEGSASEQDGVWIYIATLANSSLSGDKIIIRASDYPNNITEKEKIL
jgi:hypothetical protein|nr:hypothetical protein [uncultured Capnocytophaga sp.]